MSKMRKLVYISILIAILYCLENCVDSGVRENPNKNRTPKDENSLSIAIDNSDSVFFDTSLPIDKIDFRNMNYSFNNKSYKLRNGSCETGRESLIHCEDVRIEKDILVDNTR